MGNYQTSLGEMLREVSELMKNATSDIRSKYSTLLVMATSLSSYRRAKMQVRPYRGKNDDQQKNRAPNDLRYKRDHSNNRRIKSRNVTDGTCDARRS